MEAKAKENEWLLDCVLSFMRSPRWRAPVVSFIEEYCLVFDNEEENKLEYTNIHKVSNAKISCATYARVRLEFCQNGG